MTMPATSQRGVNTASKNSYRVYHADLLAQLEGDPGKLFLLHAIAFFDWGDTPRDTGDAFDIDHDYWQRHWHMREKARRVIQGAEPWPAWARRWKAFQELRYYAHKGRRKRPAWLDAPKRERSHWEICGSMPALNEHEQRPRKRKAAR